MLDHKMPMPTYRAAPGLNWSTFKHAISGAAWARYKRENPTEGSQLGRLVHALLLEPWSVGADFVVAPFSDFRSKEARTWKEANGDKDIITQAMLDNCKHLANTARNGSLLGKILAHPDTDTEVSCFAEVDGVACKGRFDIVSGDLLHDVKTSGALTPHEFVREAIKLRYAGQAAFYCDLAAASGLVVEGWLWHVVNDKTGTCFTVRCPDHVLAAGRRMYLRALRAYVDAERNGEWSPLTDATVVHEAEWPDWSIDQMEGEDE